MTRQNENLRETLETAYRKGLEILAKSIINGEAEIKEIKTTLGLIKEEKNAFGKPKQENTLLSKLKESKRD